jgi:hypothetical protein
MYNIQYACGLPTDQADRLAKLGVNKERICVIRITLTTTDSSTRLAVW